MAKASGMAKDGLITGEFMHKTSGVHYKVYEQDGHAWMSYERPQVRADFGASASCCITSGRE